MTNALVLIGGQLQFVIYAIGFNIFFALFCGVKRDEFTAKLNIRSFIISVVSLLFALMISAIRCIPFYLSTSENISFKLSYDEFIRINATELPALIRVFLPEFFVFLNRGEGFHSYTGIVAVFFGLYAFLMWDRKTIFWKVMAVLLTLMVIGTPLAYLHYLLTGKGNLAFGRMAMYIPICLSILFSYVGRLVMDDKRHLRRLIIFSSGIFLFVILYAISAYYHDGPIISTFEFDEVRAKQGMRAAILYFVVFSFLMLGALSFLALSKTERKRYFFKVIIFMTVLVDLLAITKISFPYLTSGNPFLPPNHFTEVLHLKRKSQVVLKRVTGTSAFWDLAKGHLIAGV